MFFTFCVFVCLFVNNARKLHGPISELRYSGGDRLASAFVGRFRWGMQPFFGEEKPFPAYRTNLKIVARWRYDWCPNGRENFQNL